MIMLPSGVSGSLLESNEPSLYGVFNGGILSSPDDINLRSGDGVNYLFTYNGLDFNAEYTYSSWKVYNSYRIVNSNDIEIICTALSNEHPVPDRDYISYRTPADMTFEWMQHNIAYNQLPEGNPLCSLHTKHNSINFAFERGKTMKVRDV